MDHIIQLLLQYKYFILFPLAIIEGPIIAVICGFLCINNILNPFIVFPIIVAGDMVGDSLVYLLGRFGIPPFLKRIAIKLGFKPEKVQKVRAYFNTNPIRTISLSKITLGIGFAGIYLAGHAKIPYPRFIIISMFTSALQYVVYLGIGLLFGHAYKQINNYIDFLTALVVIIALSVGIFLYVKSKRKKI